MKSIKIIMICFAASVIFYVTMVFGIALWMSSSDWKYDDHKLFFHIASIVPSIMMFIFSSIEELKRAR